MINSHGIKQFQELEKKLTPNISGFMLVIALVDGIVITISTQRDKALYSFFCRGRNERIASAVYLRIQTPTRLAASTSLGLSACPCLCKVQLEVTILVVVGQPKENTVQKPTSFATRDKFIDFNPNLYAFTCICLIFRPLQNLAM